MLKAMYPVLFKTDFLEIRTFWVFILIPISIGYYLAFKEFGRKGLGNSLLHKIIFPTILISYFGSRFFFELANYGFSKWIIKDTFSFGIPGIGTAHQGMIVGTIVSIFLFSYILKFSFWKTLDALTPSIVLGRSIGRLGCLFNGCCYGIPTNGGWGIRFPLSANLLHPTQLYETLLNFLIFIIVWIGRDKTKRDGNLFLFYLIAYSIPMIPLQYLRGDRSLVFGLTFDNVQVTAFLIVIAASLAWLFKERKQNPN